MTESLAAGSKRGIEHFFKPSLFWDVNSKAIDIDSHARFIIERIVTKGTWADWQNLVNIYGKQRILAEAMKIRSLDQKSFNFLTVYFNVEKEKFRCCR